MKKINVILLSLAILLVSATSGFSSVLVGTENVSFVGLLTPFGPVGMGAASFTDPNKSVLGDFSLNIVMSNNLPGVASFYGVTGTGGTVFSSGVSPTSYTGIFSDLKVDYRPDGVYQFAFFAYPLGAAPATATAELYKTNTPNKTPLPAAVWFFGTGLVGLVGLRKKRKA